MPGEVNRADQATWRAFFQGRTRATGVTEEQLNDVIDGGDVVRIGSVDVDITNGLSLAELNALFSGPARQVDTIVAEGWQIGEEQGRQASGLDASNITITELDRMNADVQQYAAYLTTLRPTLSEEESLNLARACYNAAPTLVRRSLNPLPTIDQLRNRIQRAEGANLAVRTRAALGIDPNTPSPVMTLIEAYISGNHEATAADVARYIAWLEEASHYAVAVQTASFGVPADANVNPRDAVFNAVRSMQAEAAAAEAPPAPAAAPNDRAAPPAPPAGAGNGTVVAPPAPAPALVAPTEVPDPQQVERRNAWLTFFRQCGMTIAEDATAIPPEILSVIGNNAEQTFMGNGLTEAQWTILSAWATGREAKAELHCGTFPAFIDMNPSDGLVTWEQAKDYRQPPAPAAE